jgi:dTDP-4-dehydrorhamnose 3,5-epimerase
MRFIPMELDGAYIIEPEPHEDDRGFFARVWCAREMENHGLASALAQASVAYSRRAGTLRGMHFQVPPDEEVKIVRCTSGSIFDVLIDLRPQSPTFLSWDGVTLTAKDRRAVYVPRGFAHGYQTLEDDTEVFYQMSEFYAPGSEGGIPWDDPFFDIDWPDVPTRVISEKDRRLPPFRMEMTDVFRPQASDVEGP